MTSDTNSHNWVAYLMLAGAACFWGSNHVVARDLHDTVPLIALSFWRWAFAFLMILPLAWGPLKRDWAVVKSDFHIAAWLAFIGAFIFTYTIYLAAYNTTALNVGLINATSPVWVLVVAFILTGLRPAGLQWLGVVISLIGVVWIVIKGDLARLAGLEFRVGDLWALAAAIIWAYYTLQLKNGARFNPLSLAALIFGLGALMNLPVFLFTVFAQGSPWFTTGSDVALDFVKIFYVALGPGFLGFLFWNRGVQLIGGPRAGVFLYLIPVASATLAILFLGEEVHLYHFVGTIGIVAGIYLTNRAGSASG